MLQSKIGIARIKTDIRIAGTQTRVTRVDKIIIADLNFKIITIDKNLRAADVKALVTRLNSVVRMMLRPWLLGSIALSESLKKQRSAFLGLIRLSGLGYKG
jgi:hypothetical protein